MKQFDLGATLLLNLYWSQNSIIFKKAGNQATETWVQALRPTLWIKETL